MNDDDEIARLKARIAQLEDALRSFCREANWGASALSADTIRKVNEALLDRENI